MSETLPLKDKTVFITGATSGFGRAFANKFIEKGAKVVASGRRAERLEELQDEVDSDNLYTMTLDVRNQAEVESAIVGLPAAFADIDILINNAGLALGLGLAPDISMIEWEQMIDTNIKGVLYCTHAILPDMIKRGGGYIVNIGSIAGNYPYPGGNAYGATKAFIRQFSLNLRADLLGKNVRVTNIEPGMAETEFSLVRFHGDQEKAKSVYTGAQPLTAEDIANTVLFCLTCPPHVNINTLEVMPTCQAFSPFAIYRE
ncbi:MAG TPA: SDR family NAD(P)-dependent oxidoreductase [Rickettsiales bacterium]|nr:SDR family NAD(P)-dependent oxidoreductase [Rickettsiales bacterium]